MRLTLSSSSPRRRELLSILVPHFEVAKPDIDETLHPGESPDHYVTRLAMEKAMSCATNGRVSLGADTAVVCEGQILGKPSDIDAARKVLEQLSGNVHTVFTGIGLAVGNQITSRLSLTRVTFGRLLPETIETYLQTDEPWDKAGAYGIQSYAGAFVERIEGSYSGVVGLPLYETRHLLADAGVTLRHG
ncbi:Maf family protein [Luminiphilus sp.]|nr:nucleoside triphosphate pyrophosphatase [Luminiphilus sp.]MDA9710820.1 Maf family protein [Luminiphilus sp.]